jgi:UDP-glucuronate 4-epimerase
MNKKIFFITGTAGFIGFHLAQKLLERGDEVDGVDNLCHSYYDPLLKRARLAELNKNESYRHHDFDLSDKDKVSEFFTNTPNVHSIIHLAAQACVPYSFDHPYEYIKDNIIAFQNLLEIYRNSNLYNFVYASSSSVYGHNFTKTLTHEDKVLDKPVSVYGATKIENENMAQVYFTNYKKPLVGLRFFKVYGPWARPDTVFFKFVDSIYHNKPIKVFNYGKIQHSFTYIDDIIKGVVSATDNPQAYTSPENRHPIYNLGNCDSEDLVKCIRIIEKELDLKAECEYFPLPEGDRSFTHADIQKAKKDLGFQVRTPVEVGLQRFVKWYKDIYVHL